MSVPKCIQQITLVVLCVSWYIPTSFAKGSGEGSSVASDVASQAIVNELFQSWQSATTVFAIIAEIVNLIVLRMTSKSLSDYIKLKKKGLAATDNRNIGKAFGVLAVAASFFLLAYFPLIVVYLINSTQPVVLSDPLILSGMAILSNGLVDITISSAFLILLRRRQLVHQPGTNWRWKTTLEVMIILVMIALTAVKTTLASLLFTFESLSRYEALIDIFHVYTLVYLVVIIDIIISSRMLRKILKKKALPDKVISASVCSSACFLLGTQALLRLAEEVILWMFPLIGDQNIQYDALNCVDTAVKFVTYTWALVDGVQAFFPPSPKKPEESAAQAETVQPNQEAPQVAGSPNRTSNPPARSQAP